MLVLETKNGRKVYKKTKQYPIPVINMNKDNIPEALKIMWDLVQRNIPFKLNVD